MFAPTSYKESVSSMSDRTSHDHGFDYAVSSIGSGADNRFNVPMVPVSESSPSTRGTHGDIVDISKAKREPKSLKAGINSKLFVAHILLILILYKLYFPKFVLNFF